jgi:hypothetical protein
MAALIEHTGLPADEEEEDIEKVAAGDDEEVEAWML